MTKPGSTRENGKGVASDDSSKSHETESRRYRARNCALAIFTLCALTVGIMAGKAGSYREKGSLEVHPAVDSNFDSESDLLNVGKGGSCKKQPDTKIGNTTDGDLNGTQNGGKAEDWESFNALQLYDYLECVYYSEYEVEFPIRSQETYQLMRATFHNVVGPEKSTIGLPLDGSNGFKYPYVVKQSPGKGRGIFAAADIPKGDLVWSNDRTAIFPNSWYYRKFLLSLPPSIACDCMQWTYIYDLYGLGKDNKKIMIDLDEGALCNDGEADDSSDITNIGWDRDFARTADSGNGMHLLALRDIKAGEEFLCDYTQFTSEGEVDWANHDLSWV